MHGRAAHTIQRTVRECARLFAQPSAGCELRLLTPVCSLPRRKRKGKQTLNISSNDLSFLDVYLEPKSHPLKPHLSPDTRPKRDARCDQ